MNAPQQPSVPIPQPDADGPLAAAEPSQNEPHEPASPADELGIPGLQGRQPLFAHWKPLLAGTLMLLSMTAVVGSVLWQRFGPRDSAPPPQPVAADKVAPIRFDEAPAPRAVPSSGPAPSVAAAANPVQPIALREPGRGPLVPSLADPATPTATPGGSRSARPPRDDSPFITAAWTANRPTGPAPSPAQDPAGGPPQAHLQQLDGMVRQLQALTEQARPAPERPGSGTQRPAESAPPGQPIAAGSFPPPPGVSTRPVALFGQLERSQTARAHAGMLGARSFIVPKGVLFQCALKTRIVSAVSGLVGCQLQRPVYSDDGKVVLLERGSHLDGEYRIVQVRPGVTRIPVLWTRVRTPHGVTVDLDSAATGPLGDSGIGGDVDNRWAERIGAALLLSLIDDAIRIHLNESGHNPNATIVLPGTAATTSRLAEKVLDSTINIPPLVTVHQGSVVAVYVSRDLDFSGVYRLEAR
jgi:type IV secretion system protein VirB10